jgi:hypothetical protein
MKAFTRREFIAAATAATAGGLHYGCKSRSEAPAAAREASPPKKEAAVVEKSRVVLIRDREAVDRDRKINAEVVQRMLDQAVCSLTGQPKARDAFATFLGPADVVGIKSNVWKFLPTPPKVEQALRARILELGIPEDRIGIDDRGVLQNPVFQRATALVNTRPIRTHHWSGVGSLIKNYIMFVPDPYNYHSDSCADLAAIWKMPHVRDKTRLCVLVVLTPLFHSVGPHGFNPEYLWNYGGLIVSRDPVAADAVGLSIIEAKRKAFFGDNRPLNPPAKHIQLADTRHGLGTADPARIELVKLGDDKDILL